MHRLFLCAILSYHIVITHADRVTQLDTDRSRQKRIVTKISVPPSTGVCNTDTGTTLIQTVCVLARVQRRLRVTGSHDDTIDITYDGIRDKPTGFPTLTFLTGVSPKSSRWQIGRNPTQQRIISRILV